MRNTAPEMGMDIFDFVRSSDGGGIKDSQSAFNECPCSGLDQYREYLDVRRTAFDNKKEIGGLQDETIGLWCRRDRL